MKFDTVAYIPTVEAVRDRPLSFPEFEPGQTFGNTAETKRIEEYNAIIKNEGKLRCMPVADIFPISQTMTTPDDFIADGLHPNGRGYAKWEQVIAKTMISILTK